MVSRRRHRRDTHVHARVDGVVTLHHAGSRSSPQPMTGAGRHLEVQVVGDEHGTAAPNGRDLDAAPLPAVFEEAPPTKPSGGIARPLLRGHGVEGEAARPEHRLRGRRDRRVLVQSVNDDYFSGAEPACRSSTPARRATGVNLPATQLQVAMGIPLPNMPEVRRLHGIDESDTSTVLDLDDPNTKYRLIQKHVSRRASRPRTLMKASSPRRARSSACRFNPHLPSGATFGRRQRGVHEFADSQFGHLFATGEVLKRLEPCAAERAGCAARSANLWNIWCSSWRRTTSRATTSTRRGALSCPYAIDARRLRESRFETLMLRA